MKYVILMMITFASLSSFADRSNPKGYEDVGRETVYILGRARTYCENYAFTATRQAWTMDELTKSFGCSVSDKSLWNVTEAANDEFCITRDESVAKEQMLKRAKTIMSCLNDQDEVEADELDLELFNKNPEELGEYFVIEGVQNNSIPKTKQAIAAGASLNWELWGNDGPAARFGILNESVEVLKYLSPIKVYGTTCYNCTSNGGVAPLLGYLWDKVDLDNISERSLDFIEFLVKNGASVTGHGESSPISPVMYVLNQPKILKLFLKYQKDRIFSYTSYELDGRFGDSYNLLHALAIGYSASGTVLKDDLRLESAIELLKAGIDVNAKASDGQTALCLITKKLTTPRIVRSLKELKEIVEDPSISVDRMILKLLYEYGAKDTECPEAS